MSITYLPGASVPVGTELVEAPSSPSFGPVNVN